MDTPLTATITVKELSGKLTTKGKPSQIIKDEKGLTYHFVNGNLELGKKYTVEYTEFPSTDPKYKPSRWIAKVITPTVAKKETVEKPTIEEVAKKVFNAIFTPQVAPQATPLPETKEPATIEANPLPVRSTDIPLPQCESREIGEIKDKLKTMDKIYENQALKVVQLEAKFKKTEAIYDQENAKLMMIERELNPESKEGAIKEKVEDKMINRRIDLIGVEAAYKHEKAILESIDKSIQLLRNRSDILVAEIYSHLHFDRISNIKKEE